VVDVGGGPGTDADVEAGRHQYKVSTAAANDDELDSNVNEDADAKKALVASKDEILTKLLEDCTKSESRTAANISKYYFHEALLEKHEESDASLLAATEEMDAAEDLKPIATTFARDGKEASPSRFENATFGTKLEARKPSSETTVHCGAFNGNFTSGRARKRRSTDLDYTETEVGTGLERPHKRPAKEVPTASSPAVLENAGKRLSAEITNHCKASTPMAHSSTQHDEQPKIKTESPALLLVSPRDKRKAGLEENHADTNSASMPSRRHLDPNETQESSLSAAGSRRKESSLKIPDLEVIDISSDEDNL
jgi:hypothetical protein